MMPGISVHTCIACASLEEASESTVELLSALAAVCGILIIITAGCEQMELKWHGVMYAMCVIITDLVAGVVLSGGFVVGVMASMAAALSCEPDEFLSVIKDGGADSSEPGTTAGVNTGAAVAIFFVKILVPVFEGMCELSKPLQMYACAAAIGLLGSLASFLASLCVCMNCSSDGTDGFDDDHKAVQMQQLMAGQ